MTSKLGKLAKVLELLRSSHEGEQLAAVRSANAILRDLNVTWTELVTGYEYGAERTRIFVNSADNWATTTAKPRRYAEPDVEITSLARSMLEHPQFSTLAEKHQIFVAQMANLKRRPTDRQREYLHGLADTLVRAQHRQKEAAA